MYYFRSRMHKGSIFSLGDFSAMEGGGGWGQKVLEKAWLILD